MGKKCIRRDALKRIPPLPIMRVVTVPHAGWYCSVCRDELEPGSQAVKAGKAILCPKCVQEGQESDATS